jgi:peptide/nickel transport system substrate-binding protein
VDRSGRERSSPKTRHPTLSDPAVREALNLLVDRASIQEYVYGRGGTPTRNFLNNPQRFRSPNTKWEFSVDKANRVLEAAGWKLGERRHSGEGGKKLKFVFQTSHQRPAPEVPADHQAGLPEGGHRHGAQVSHGVRVLLSDTANPTRTPSSTPTSRCSTSAGRPIRSSS